MVERNLSAKTLFWHDYETFGTNPQKDGPVQFAGVRTDYQFNQLEDPLVVYCKPSLDSLPHPDACLITGITPSFADQQGLCQAEFARLIYEQMARPDTCTLGYNSLRFDDEVTRNCLYRNFYDPYAREWQHGNTRWDIIDAARAAQALRPEGIIWPKNDDGRPDFKLEELCKANQIRHIAAHDALSDVYATLALAKLIKKVQPKLYAFLWQNRNKSSALELLQLSRSIPVVHISGKYPALKNCLAIVLPICKHPGNPNGVIVYDLSIDPEPMLSLSASVIRQRIFTATKDLPASVERIPLKTVHINKCPVLAPISVIRPEDERRLELDLAVSRQHVHKINAAFGLAAKLAEVFKQEAVELQESDPDLEIYTGGFFSGADKHNMAVIRTTPSIQLARKTFTFSDKRLPEMLFRYRARNFPETLTSDETARWKKFCVERLTGLKPGAGIILNDYFARLNELSVQDNANLEMLKDLEAYAFEKMDLLGIDANSLRIE
jgi:exodeoxyribonuclease-1